MMKGIQEYLSKKQASAALCATDIKDRGYKDNSINYLEYNKDFLADNYEDDFPIDIDYIIMNPPYSLIEPFVMKSLSIADKGILMLARLQFLEGKGRYENILKDNPPTDIYVYVDRIKCYKNGDESDNSSSAQAYAWFYWNLEYPAKKISKAQAVNLTDEKLEINEYAYDSEQYEIGKFPIVHWIRRAE